MQQRLGKLRVEQTAVLKEAALAAPTEPLPEPPITHKAIADYLQGHGFTVADLDTIGALMGAADIQTILQRGDNSPVHKRPRRDIDISRVPGATKAEAVAEAMERRERHERERLSIEVECVLREFGEQGRLDLGEDEEEGEAEGDNNVEGVNNAGGSNNAGQ